MGLLQWDLYLYVQNNISMRALPDSTHSVCVKPEGMAIEVLLQDLYSASSAGPDFAQGWDLSRCVMGQKTVHIPVVHLDEVL